MCSLNLEELSLQHNKITDRAKKLSFYEDTLYPALLKNVVSLPTVNPPLDLLLLPVSNRFVPVLAAARWKPRVAFAIYSSRSEVYRSNIESDIAALGLEITCKGEKVDNIEIEPERLYKVIREIIQPF